MTRGIYYITKLRGGNAQLRFSPIDYRGGSILTSLPRHPNLGRPLLPKMISVVHNAHGRKPNRLSCRTRSLRFSAPTRSPARPTSSSSRSPHPRLSHAAAALRLPHPMFLSIARGDWTAPTSFTKATTGGAAPSPLTAATS